MAYLRVEKRGGRELCVEEKMSKRTSDASSNASSNASSKGSKKPRRSSRVGLQKYGLFWSGTTSDPEIITVLVNRRDFAFHYDAKTSRLNLVQEVWEHEIIPFLNVKELALLRPTCRWCNEQWQEFLKRNTFRVPEQVPTINEAMRVGLNLSKQKEYSKGKPLVVMLSEGEHAVEGNWTCPISLRLGRTLSCPNTLEITSSNISFIGQGKDKTTVQGGFGMLNKKNVTVKDLILTNPYGFNGLDVQGEEASVEMMGVSVRECGDSGLYVTSGASVKATQCEISENGDCGVVVLRDSKGIFTDCSIHHNGSRGLCASMQGTLVELRGEQTEIHHNGESGLCTWSNAISNIYIPSRSITTLVHDNSWRDLSTLSGGKIQSQLSSSSLDLTVIHPVALP